MLGYRHKTSQDSKQALAVTLGVLLGVVILLAGTAIMAENVSNSGSYSFISPGVILTSFGAGLFGTLATIWTGRGSCLKISAMIAGVLTLCNIFIAIFCFDGIHSGIWKSAVALFAGAFCCGWIGLKRRNKHRYKK